MPSPERGLVTGLLENPDIAKLLPNIKRRWFFDEKALQAYDLIRQHYDEYREPLSLSTLKEKLPGFIPEHYKENLKSLATRVEEKWLRVEIGNVSDTFVTEGALNAKEALSDTMVRLLDLKKSLSTRYESDVASSMDYAYDRYVHRRDNRGRLGLPFMWHPMQAATNGAQNGGYYLFYARPKNMKTFVMIAQAISWYYTHKRRVMFITRELSIEQMQDRILCMFAEVDYSRFRSGDLTEAEELCLEDAATVIKETGNLHVDRVDGHGAAAASQISLLADQYEIGEGDVICIDGLYFYAQNSEWSSFGAFSRSIKQLFLERNCIGLCTSQANRNYRANMQADSGTEMQMGDQPIQDCDAAVKLSLDSEENHLVMMMSTLREGKPAQWTSHAIPCVDFTLKFSDRPPEPSEEASTPPPPNLAVINGQVRARRAGP